MFIEPIFSTPIWSEILNLNLDEIESFAYEEKDKDCGKQVSNQGGWQSKDYYLNDLENTPLAPLINNVRKLLPICCQTLEVSKTPKIDNVWININPPGSYNKPHIHGNNCFLSACFYIKTPENCGGIYFDRGSLQEYILSNFVSGGTNSFSSSRWFYTPVPNQIIIFPAWLSHSVEVNNSNEDRISIALNVKV